MDVIFIIGIFLSFFLQFLLLSKKNASKSDRILAVWMFIFGIHLFSFYIYSLGYWDRYPHLVGITLPFPLLHGPMLYLYVLFSVRSSQRFTWKELLHFAPATGAYLYMIPFFFFYTSEQKVLLNNGEIDDFALFQSAALVAFVVSGIAYPVFSYRLLGKYSRLIKENFAFEESISLNWLKFCIWGIGIIYVVIAIMLIFWDSVEVILNPDLIIYSLIILFIFLLGYSGIRHQGIFTDGSAEEAHIVEPKPGEYRRSGLKESDAERYHRQLKELMSSKKPYLEPKLTLNSLAEELDISANHLSQIINQQEGKNFYDFVNEYRVEEFKSRAADPANSNYSILAIALDSGFNSKSSFNQVFKKAVGKTPSEFMKG